MGTFSIIITAPAEEDLFQIGRYISKEIREPETAMKVISKIASSIYTLEDLPYRYGIVKDERLALLRLRHMIVDNYVVFYTVHEENNEVIIIRILYKKRNWINLL